MWFYIVAVSLWFVGYTKWNELSTDDRRVANQFSLLAEHLFFRQHIDSSTPTFQLTFEKYQIKMLLVALVVSNDLWLP